MIAIGRSLRISPRKANLIAGLVQGKSATEAVVLLERLPKKGAALILKVLKSAIANAVHNDGQSEADLTIERVLVLKAPTMKRFRPISRGRAAPLLKRSSHIRVELKVA